MTEEKLGDIRFDVGLTSIDRLERPRGHLPAQRETRLIGGRTPRRVEKLFEDASLDSAMRRFAAPHLSDPSLLVPARFEHLIREGARRMQEIAKRGNRPVLQRAGEILDEEMELRDLLTDYRTALMQG